MSTSDFNKSKATRVISGDKAGPSRSWFADVEQFSDNRDTAEFVKSTFSQSGNNTQAERQVAQQQGYDEGYQQGLEAANGEVQALRLQLETTLSLLQNPLEKIDTQVEHELLELSLEVARQILRREIKADPRHIIGLIRDAVKQLPSAAEDINLHLHPEDAGIVRDTLQKHQSDKLWQVTDDPTVPRGDCQVHASPSFIHVGVDSIVGQLAADFFGDDRSATVPTEADK